MISRALNKIDLGLEKKELVSENKKNLEDQFVDLNHEFSQV